jgi:hypothetical protein
MPICAARMLGLTFDVHVMAHFGPSSSRFERWIWSAVNGFAPGVMNGFLPRRLTGSASSA